MRGLLNGRNLFVAVAVAALGALLIGLYVAASDDAAEQAACVGTVADKFTTYDPGYNMNVGGDKNGAGGMSIPVGNGTVYHLALHRADGADCDRRVKKSAWLAARPGSAYPVASAASGS